MTDFDVKRFMKMLAAFSAALTMVMATILGAMALNVTYDFDDCSTLAACNMTERGSYIGANQTYITTYDGRDVLYYNGQRNLPQYFVLSFDDVPNNVTAVEFDVFPVDASYSEFIMITRATDYWISDSPSPAVVEYWGNNDYYDNSYITISGATGQYCDKLTVGQWNNVKLVLNYTDKTYTYYKDDVFNCAIDVSMVDLNTLGDIAHLYTRTGDTPNVYFDKFVFSNDEVEIDPVPEEVQTTYGKTRYLVNADGEVVGVQYNNQVVTTTPLSVAGSVDGFSFKNWFNGLFERVKGVFK